MNFRFDIEVERDGPGKFASKADIEEALIAEIEQIQLGGLGADGETDYVVTSVDAVWRKQ